MALSPLHSENCFWRPLMMSQAVGFFYDTKTPARSHKLAGHTTPFYCAQPGLQPTHTERAWHQPRDPAPLNKQQLQAVKDHFQAFLNGDTQIVADEAFCNAGFLKSERVSRMVQSGGCSAFDFRDVFKKDIERRVRSLPKIDGLSKETVLSSWIAKYDTIYRGDEDLRRQPQRMPLSAVSEMILSKEQLYEMFQQILGIKKFEHQLLYNACQWSEAEVRRGGRVGTRKLPRQTYSQPTPLFEFRVQKVPSETGLVSPAEYDLKTGPQDRYQDC
ncbi:unnamed protein product [Coregonus sp. 'balchen']|nr:unnamed protein product [Coregonus sp. 'balchen']